MGNSNTIYVVGAGAGNPGLITQEAAQVIASCHYVAGGGHLLGLAPEGAETFTIGADLDGAAGFIADRAGRGDVCVLTSGDPGCFSLLPYLKKKIGAGIKVIPGISSLQLLAARLGIPWQDWRLRSLHGRNVPEARILSDENKTVFFCDDENSPQVVAEMLLAQTVDRKAIVASNLGSNDERLSRDNLTDIAAGSYPGNSLLLVDEASPEDLLRRRQASPPGIADELWRRREGVPMSKSEVRSVLLGKAQPGSRGVIWDVGTGTGTYSVECSLMEPGASIFAIDKKREACELAVENARLFGANIQVVRGEAPACFADLPAPDLVIIGGNDGRLDEIFAGVLRELNPGGRVVVTAVLERTKKAAHELFAGSGLENRTGTRISVERGKNWEWQRHNPVIIYTGDKQGGPADE